MYTRKLAEEIQKLNYENLPKEVIQRAKEAILDTIGVTLAGSKSDSADILNDFVEGIGGRKESTIIGKNRRNSSVNAAMVNSATGHVLDYDDVSWSIIGHPAVVTLFPALALSEVIKASGKELLTAFVAGYETVASIGRGLVPDFNEKGWHSTATIGSFGAAAAACKIYSCNVEETIRALGVVGSLASGVKGNMGTMTKHLQVGRAASNGITAALLAKRGYTASEKILEGKDGFCSVFAPKYDLDKMVESFGNPFDLVSGGAIFKKWPSCYSTHPCIEAVTTLTEENNLSPEQVEKIDIGSTPLVLDVLFYNEPKTGFEGKFSDQFCAAVSIVKRKAYIEEFSDQVVNDPVIRDLMKKVTLSTDPELSKSGYVLSSEEGPTKTRVTITLKNGRKLFKEVAIAKGAPERRLSEEEVIDKYRNCAALVLKKGGVNQSIDLIRNTEKMDSVLPLIDILKG
jgi:2-methylcitrate dehydratase PrpD